MAGTGTPANQRSKPSRPQDGPAVLFGVAVVAAFLGGFGAWAALAPLESAAIALGSVKSDSNRKTIQHLEGGIVTKILVRDGDTVSAGQELIRLDDTQPNAALELLRGRYWAAKALAARLIAERDEAERMTLSPDLANAGHAAAREAVASQARIFAARRAAIAGKTSILRQRIAALREEEIGLKSKIDAQGSQLRLIGEEVADVKFLVQKELARKPRLLELQRVEAEIAGARGENVALVARARERVAETELQILDLQTTLANEVVKELREAERELYDVAERLRAAEDVIARTRIVAPLDGVVVGLKVHTTGGV
jgi:HlyD family type I secretion membrane fusion protein